MKKKKANWFNWRDLKQVIQFKTFYLIVVLMLVGIVCLFVEAFAFSYDSTSSFRGIFSSLGITFITSSTISLLVEIFIRLDIVDFMLEKIQTQLSSRNSADTGVVEFSLDRTGIDFDTIWHESKSFLKVMGISANDILSSNHMHLLKRRIRNEPNFSIKILLLNPWSIVAKRRSSIGVYGTEFDCVKRIYSVMEELKDAKRYLEKTNVSISNIDVRLYDDFPSVSMIIDTENAIVATLTTVAQGGSSPYFIAKNIKTEECIYSLYSKHFDQIWEDAMSIFELDYKSIYEKTMDVEKDRATSLPSDLKAWLHSVFDHS